MVASSRHSGLLVIHLSVVEMVFLVVCLFAVYDTIKYLLSFVQMTANKRLRANIRRDMKACFNQIHVINRIYNLASTNIEGEMESCGQ